MTKKGKAVYKIYENIVSKQTILCTKCKDSDFVMDYDEYAASMHFYSIGWHATNSNCYCPKCNKKNKK